MLHLLVRIKTIYMFVTLKHQHCKQANLRNSCIVLQLLDYPNEQAIALGRRRRRRRYEE